MVEADCGGGIDPIDLGDCGSLNLLTGQILTFQVKCL
jgi:hypothetical protein